MALSSINNLLTAIWEVIRDRIPPRSAYESSATITRAANTTIYNASAPNFDVYGSLFQLQNIGEAGKGIFLSYFEISLDLSAVPQGMTSFAVQLYPTEPTAIADNSLYSEGLNLTLAIKSK